MAEQKVTMKSDVMNIKDIHRYETWMFWIERLAILTLLLSPTAQVLHISSFAASVLVATNLFYSALFFKRQSIRRFFFEPDAIFYIERPAISIVLLPYVLPDAHGQAAAVLGLTVLFLTNFVMLDRYKYRRTCKGKDLAMKGSSNSSKTKTTNAKETSKNVDQRKEENVKGDELLEKKVELEEEGEGLQEASNMGGSNIAGNFYTNDGEWFSGYLSIWDSSVPANGDKEEDLQMNSTPIIEPKSPTALEPSKEESEVSDEFEEIDAYLEESENRSASKEEDQNEVKEVNDEATAESDLTLNDQQIIDEVEEAKDDVQVAAGNNYKSDKSDDDSSWEEVQGSLDGKLSAEIASSDQKKTDELAEAGHEEETRSCSDSDEICSWVEGEINLNRRPCASSTASSDSNLLQEQLHLYEAMSLQWEQEKRDLTGQVDVVTKLSKQYEENYNKLQKEVSVQCTDMINELKRELLGMEKFNFKAKLDAATKIEKDPADDRDKWNEKMEYLQSKLNAATESLQKERLKLEDEEREKRELHQKLETTAMDLARYKELEKGFAEERRKWDEEKVALSAIISHADENVQYCQTLVNIYAEHYRLLGIQHVASNHSNLEEELKKLKEERDDLSAKVNDANSWVESYKVRYDRSEEHCEYYKACFEEYEEKYRKLKEENLDMSAKLLTETSFAERYKRLVNDLEDKCHKLEEEKIDLTAKLCASKAASELYRACLLDFPS